MYFIARVTVDCCTRDDLILFALSPLHHLVLYVSKLLVVAAAALLSPDSQRDARVLEIREADVEPIPVRVGRGDQTPERCRRTAHSSCLIIKPADKGNHNETRKEINRLVI